MIGAQYAVAQQLADKAREESVLEYQRRLGQANDDFEGKNYWPAYVGYHTVCQLSGQADIAKRLRLISTRHLTDSEKLWAKCLGFGRYSSKAQAAIVVQLTRVTKAGFCPCLLDEAARTAFKAIDLDGLKSFLLDALARPLEVNLSRQRGWWLALMPGSALHELFAIQNGPNQTSLGTGTLAAIANDLVDYHIEQQRPLRPETVQMLRNLDFFERPLLVRLLKSLQEHAPALYDLVQSSLPYRIVTAPPAETSSEALAGMKPRPYQNAAGERIERVLFDPVGNEFL